MYPNPGAAYENATKAAPSTRQLEAAALFKAARMLDSCQQNWQAPNRQARLDEALRYNQRLWTFFQAELEREDHPINPNLRRDLLRLCAFVDRRTFELMASPDPEKLRVLVEVNRNVASGLAAETA